MPCRSNTAAYHSRPCKARNPKEWFLALQANIVQIACILLTTSFTSVLRIATTRKRLLYTGRDASSVGERELERESWAVLGTTVFQQSAPSSQPPAHSCVTTSPAQGSDVCAYMDHGPCRVFDVCAYMGHRLCRVCDSLDLAWFVVYALTRKVALAKSLMYEHTWNMAPTWTMGQHETMRRGARKYGLFFFSKFA